MKKYFVLECLIFILNESEELIFFYINNEDSVISKICDIKLNSTGSKNLVLNINLSFTYFILIIRLEAGVVIFNF